MWFEIPNLGRKGWHWWNKKWGTILLYKDGTTYFEVYFWMDCYDWGVVHLCLNCGRFTGVFLLTPPWRSIKERILKVFNNFY